MKCLMTEFLLGLGFFVYFSLVQFVSHSYVGKLLLLFRKAQPCSVMGECHKFASCTINHPVENIVYLVSYNNTFILVQ